MKYSFLLPLLTLSLGSATLAETWDPNAQDADYTTLTASGQPLGNTNPTGTYGIVLQTDDSDSKKFKRGITSKNVVKAIKKTNALKKAEFRNRKQHKKNNSENRRSPVKVMTRNKKNAATRSDSGSTIASSVETALTTDTADYDSVNDYYESGESYYTTALDDDEYDYEATATDDYQSETTETPDVYDDSEAGVVEAYVQGSVNDDDSTLTVLCFSECSTGFNITNGIMIDESNKIGYIASDGHFQFDSNTPQEGALYAAGWSISDDYYLGLGDQVWFYGCPQDDHYKVYATQAYDNCIDVMVKMYGIDTSC